MVNEREGATIVAETYNRATGKLMPEDRPTGINGSILYYKSTVSDD